MPEQENKCPNCSKFFSYFSVFIFIYTIAILFGSIYLKKEGDKDYAHFIDESALSNNIKINKIENKNEEESLTAVKIATSTEENN
ncbi:MAG: hypothetical protein MJ252_02200 [archaeon]|nr:hypothetical protein [archaeon]